MKKITWGSDDFIKKVKEAELNKKEEHIRFLIESGASREKIEKVLDSFR